MRTEPCKNCGSVDRYVKGKFSYCRPCHSEAQKRYITNKSLGLAVPTKNAPNRSLEYLISLGNKTNLKANCRRGHPYSGDNVRIEQQHGRLKRRCKACERDAKRVSYGLAPASDPVRLSDLLDS